MPFVETQDIKYIARLARLRLKEQDAERLAKQMDKILDYVHQLSSLDTKDVKPTSHIVGIKNVFRDDKVKPSISKEEVLRCAPVREGDFFKVPKVIEE